MYVFNAKCGAAKIYGLRLGFLNSNLFSHTLFKQYDHLYIHTYIIGHCNPSVRIIEVGSHTTYVLCVNFHL